jgi:hypothetical protein
MGFIYVLVIFLLVRPGSQGPGLVNSITTGTTNLVKAGTGGGSWSG